MGAAQKRPVETPTMPTREQLDALVAAANSNIPGAIDKLRQVLTDLPEIWQRVGDMGKQAEAAIIVLIARGDKLIQESLLKQLEQMRSDLHGASPSPMEKVLVDRFVLLWLHAQHVSTAYQIQPETQSIASGRYLSALRESAQRQLNLALQAITTYRKLGSPKFTIARPTIPFPTDSEGPEP